MVAKNNGDTASTGCSIIYYFVAKILGDELCKEMIAYG
jgi:hypothetical protein